MHKVSGTRSGINSDFQITRLGSLIKLGSLLTCLAISTNHILRISRIKMTFKVKKLFIFGLYQRVYKNSNVSAHDNGVFPALAQELKAGDGSWVFQESMEDLVSETFTPLLCKCHQLPCTTLQPLPARCTGAQTTVTFALVHITYRHGLHRTKEWTLTYAKSCIYHCLKTAADDSDINCTCKGVLHDSKSILIHISKLSLQTLILPMSPLKCLEFEPVRKDFIFLESYIQWGSIIYYYSMH
jgi:hypothetical protein